MKVQVVFFVQGIVPSSVTLWSSFFMREVHDSTLRFYVFFWNWFEGVLSCWLFGCIDLFNKL